MTIAEKLTKIAENEKKVYDAGYKAGYKAGYADAPKPKITFTIDSFSVYEAEEGMTWGEWCGSKYNTDGYYINDWGGVTKDGMLLVKDFNWTSMTENDVIEANYYYNLGV